MGHGQVAADVMTLAFRLQNDVIACAVQVGDAIDLRRVDLKLRPPAVARILAAPNPYPPDESLRGG